MVVLSNIVKPKTHKGRLALERRAPKVVELPKTTVFIRGANASNHVVKVMKDLEHLVKVNQGSLFGVASHSKKKPHNLVLGRTFDHQLLDMFEFGVEEFKALEEFKCAKVSSRLKPMVIVAGDQFESDHNTIRLKNFLIDFFTGPRVDRVSRFGLEHLIHITLVDDVVMFRSYKVRLLKSGQTTPRVELEEIGPRLDLKLRRNRLASDDLFKTARKQPKELKPKKKRNIERTALGATMGRIHMERQDYSKLHTRKLKGLKKKGGFSVSEMEESESAENGTPVAMETE